MTRRFAPTVIGLGCALSLLLACYRPVLFEGRQFAYRDAAHFYFPLHLRVQQEWDAGRVPLWDPGQNGGMPLLGNPTAAVLYPGKLIFAALPYARAARLYVVAHTIVAFAGMVALGRSLGVGRAGSILGGLSYAFGAPVLFQYCNVIFLVGAAWVPWSLRALDRLLRRRRRLGGPELALFLALQVLGGDPQAAYLTALCGAGYAVVLAREGRGRPVPLPAGPKVLAIVGAWLAVALGLGFARIDPTRLPAARAAVLLAWAVAAIGLFVRWRRGAGEARLAPMLAALAGSCALAMALSAAQLVPCLELVGMSSRLEADAWSKLMYRFSVEPYRVLELAWPNVYGTPCPVNRSWAEVFPPAGGRELWVASLYQGGLALVLALGAFGLRRGPAWRPWLSAVAAAALLASFGKFAGPLWWARWTGLAAALGPHDPGFSQPRVDPSLDDGFLGPYGLMATLLPGFGAFRYPGKLLTFSAAALAVLAGAGWDGLVAGEAKAVRRLARIGVGLSLAGLAIVVAGRPLAVAFLAVRVPPDPSHGPVDIAGAWAETRRALALGAVVYASALGLARWAPRRPRLAGAVALAVVAADLAAANAGLIWTVPEADFEAPSQAAALIAAAERDDPSPGPFRVHRMADWQPSRFVDEGSSRRFHEMIARDRATLRPLYALPLGLDYAVTPGYLDLEDYVTFFVPQTAPVSAAMAGPLGLRPGDPVCYFPRRSFDLWGARYFIVPARPDGWGRVDRGFVSFLAGTDLIYPARALLSADGDPSRRAAWARDHDWRLLRNRAAYPRAWVVHYARIRPPASDPADKLDLLREMLFQNDPFWGDPDRPVFDLRSMAFIETDDPAGLRGFVARRAVGPSESVTVVTHEPQRVELRAVLDRPGLVILADTFYPGWRLTIDGQPAPIHRANRMMRGAAVPAGAHTLVYTFAPASFRIGLVASAAGLVVLLVSAWRARAGPLDPDRKAVAPAPGPG